MDREQYAEVKRLYFEALDLDPSEVPGFLAEARVSDEVREAVLGMLETANQDVAFLDEARPPEDVLPERIGQYRVLRIIGRGAMGVVYEAEQEAPRRRVALKLINRALLSSDLLRRFELEGEFQGRLQHPGIARVHDAGLAETVGGQQPFLAMEMVEGEDLETFAGKVGRNERIELVASLCEAVEHAHQRGVIHRDLKPANIIVNAEGHPVILDFGIARAVDMQKSLATRTGELVGTLPYMSPEQVSGDPRAIDTRADVYALGVLLYQLLTGRLPIEPGEDSIYGLVTRVQEEEAPRLGELDRSLSGDLEVIARVALDKDKDRRYATASALAADLRRHLRHEPITARPPSAIYQFKKFVRRNRIATATLSLAIISLVVGIVMTSREVVAKNDALERERQALTQETAERARAERGFDGMRELIRSGLFDVYYEIDDKPGTDRGCEMLLATALEYLAVLEESAQPSEKLTRELVRGYGEMGDIIARVHRRDEEKLKEALELTQRSLAYQDDLVSAGLKIPPDHVHRARNLLLLAQIQRDLGKTDEALIALEEAEQQALAAEPYGGRTGFNGLRERIQSQVDRATTLTRAGDDAKALAALKETGALTERLVKMGEAVGARPGDAEFLRMAVLFRHGRLQFNAEDFAAARDTYAQASDSAATLLAAKPNSAVQARSVLGGARLAAFAARRIEDHEGSRRITEKAIETVRPILEADQDTPRLDFELAYCFQELALAREALEPGSGRSAWQSLLDLTEKRLARSPDDERFEGLRRAAQHALD